PEGINSNWRILCDPPIILEQIDNCTWHPPSCKMVNRNHFYLPGGHAMDNRTNDLQLVNAIRRNLEGCILGKSEEIDRLLAALLAGGHVLLEDVPGTGKTQLVKALAKAVGGQFRRIQCNPDLLPTDITGVSIYHPREETFLFR